MPLSDKITNIIGVALPDYIVKQLETRSQKGSLESRNDNNNLIYLEGKNAWVRLISSINLKEEQDRKYFSELGVPMQDETSLAKQYVLFGGTSIYLNKNSYKSRSGLPGITPGISANEAQYSPLGNNEIKKYGYRPMPGITNVSIETQGRLGSVRSATINFKCWDKDQLDIMDTLYFKLGYTMFLEWGQTNYYNNEGTRQSSEIYSIDPFEKSLTKEEINRKIATNSRDSEGNYDAMIGMTTNYTFSYNQEGGYDCTIKLISLGILAESIKINNATDFPNIISGVIADIKVKEEERRKQELETIVQNDKQRGIDITEYTFDELINAVLEFKENNGIPEAENKLVTSDKPILYNASNVGTYEIEKQDIKFTIRTENGAERDYLALRKKQALIPIISDENSIKVKLNAEKISEIIDGKIIVLDPYDGYNAIKLNLNNKKGWQGQFIDDFKTRVYYTNRSNNEYYYLVQIRTDNDLEIKALESNKQIDKIKDTINGTIDSESIKVLPMSIYLDEGDNPKTDANLTKIINEFKNQISTQSWPTKITYIKDIKEYSAGLPNYQSALLFTTTVEVTLEDNAAFSFSYTDSTGQKTQGSTKAKALYKIQIEFSYTDTDFIEDIKVGFRQPLESEAYDESIKAQDQVEQAPEVENTEEQKVSATQSRDSRIPLSAIEQILRAIVLQSYNEADKFKNPIVDPIDLTKGQFYKRIFSEGIFSEFIEDLIQGKIPDSNFDSSTSDKYKFKVYAKYGFATSLLSNRIKLYQNGKKNFKEVDFKKLLKSYVIRYDINPLSLTGNIEEIEQNNINHPVYIPLGFLLMIINSCGSLYDVTNKDNKKPIIYIDFNPNYNLCLSCPQQLSIDPWKFMIPFQGEANDFLLLFPKDLYTQKNSELITGIQADIKTGINYIYPPAQSGFSPEEIFDPNANSNTNGDYVSYGLLPFKQDGDSDSLSSYRGKIMNILVNVDYLLGLLYDMSSKNDEFKVILKDYIDQILSDANKTLGNFNSFRLSYSDAANTLQIIDDQFVPTNADEKQIYTTTGNDNYIQLPLKGKNSIARSLDIKTEVTTRLSSMVAISANSNVSKNVGGIDGNNIGFINTGYVDRYVTDISLSNYKEKEEGKNADQNVSDGTFQSAIAFNQAVRSIYGANKLLSTNTTGSILSKAQIEPATNFYLERITDVKSEDSVTRASMMIPVSLNFTTDGISGLAMGYAFTIPEELIPYTYSATRKSPTKTANNKVGFIITDVGNTIEGNQWITSVKGNMIFLKDQSAKGRQKEIFITKTSISPNYNSIIDNNAWSAMFISYVMKESGVKFPVQRNHINYLNEVIKNPNKYDVIHINPNSNWIKQGDIIVRSRNPGSDIKYSATGYPQGESHGDIVTEFSYNDIRNVKAIGGNLSDSVNRVTYSYVGPVSPGSKYQILQNSQGYKVFAILRLKDQNKVKTVIDATNAEFEKWNNPKFKEQDLAIRETLAKYFKLVGLNIT